MYQSQDGTASDAANSRITGCASSQRQLIGEIKGVKVRVEVNGTKREATATFWFFNLFLHDAHLLFGTDLVQAMHMSVRQSSSVPPVPFMNARDSLVSRGRVGREEQVSKSQQQRPHQQHQLM